MCSLEALLMKSPIFPNVFLFAVAAELVVRSEEVSRFLGETVEI